VARARGTGSCGSPSLGRIANVPSVICRRRRKPQGTREISRNVHEARNNTRVVAFCGEADFDTASLSGNTFEIEWPPKSGRRQSFPEVDRAEWFDLESARSKILSGQIELIDRFEKVGL
jgi:hypothetical protein